MSDRLKKFFLKNKYICFLLALYLIAELIVNPRGNFPLNDDWTYGKSVLSLFLEGKYNIGTSASTLWTHLMWGFGFTKIFGFSFEVLRASTIVSAVIGLLVLYRLVMQISGKASVAFVACLVLLFNPIYFNLSNTYMTDVNFSTVLLCCFYFIIGFFRTGKWLHFIMVFVFSMLLVLLRQFGIIVPLCFTFACLFRNDRRWLYSIMAFALLAGVFCVFRLYENYLEKNELAPGYVFTGKIDSNSQEFWKNLFKMMGDRHKSLIEHLATYSFPFLIIYLVTLIRSSRLVIVLPSAVLCFAVGFGYFWDKHFPLGNIFDNMNVGAETFYQFMNPFSQDVFAHTFNATFANMMAWGKCGNISLFFLCLLLAAVSRIKHERPVVRLNPMLAFFATFITGYIFLMMVSKDIYFDRYHLPLIIALIIIFAHFSKKFSDVSWLAAIFIVPMFYISVAGTKDYFTINKQKWEAYRYLRFTKGVPMERINAGYEINCWHDGKPFIYYEFIFLDTHNYVIQYRPEPDFVRMKAYPFQRYFPYKQDTVFIYGRVENLR